MNRHYLISLPEKYFDSESEAGTEGLDQIKGCEYLSRHESRGTRRLSRQQQLKLAVYLRALTAKHQALLLEKDIEYLNHSRYSRISPCGHGDGMFLSNLVCRAWNEVR